jgi:hypothetical protein
LSDNVLAVNQVAGMRHQKYQQLERTTLEMDRYAVQKQLVSLEVQLIIPEVIAHCFACRDHNVQLPSSVAEDLTG